MPAYASGHHNGAYLDKALFPDLVFFDKKIEHSPVIEGVMIKVGDRFGRLLIVSKGDTITSASGRSRYQTWNCICDCGTNKIAKTDYLNAGWTKSCGCLKSELCSARSYKLINGRRKYDPWTASAREIWNRSYCSRDPLCNITFEQFLDLTQQNCSYCGSPPNNKHNAFKKLPTYSQKAKADGDFIYNGLDRINPKIAHLINNVVPCCWICNRAKRCRTLNDFLKWIDRLETKNFKPLNIPILELPDNNYLITTVKYIFYAYKKDSDLSIEEFYYLSQQDCFYCGNTPTNKANAYKQIKKALPTSIEKAEFIYNGIDRIDTKGNHSKDNVVPCCKWCNFAKNSMTLENFNGWIDTVKNFLNERKKLRFYPQLL